MSDLSREFSDMAAVALEHPLVQNVLDEFALNMGFKREGLSEYGLMKIVNVVGQVSIAVSRNIDPDLLRATPEDWAAEAARRFQVMAEAGQGIRALIIVPEDPEQ